MVNPAFMVRKIVSPGIPYIAVGVGWLIFRNAWVAIFGYHIGMVIIILLAQPGIPVKRVFKSNNCKTPIITAIVGASVGILLYVLWPLLSVPDDLNLYLQNSGLTGKTWPLFLAYFIFVNPLIEEYYWRGYLGSNSKRIELNDLLWAGYHLIVLAGKMGIIWLAVVFLVLSTGAWFWRQANRLSEGLLASTVSHIAGDITVIFTIYSALKG